MSDIPTHAESLPGDHLDRLIHSHLDDSLSAEGVRELEGLLRDSATARARFWELAEVDGLGRDAARRMAMGVPPFERVEVAALVRDSWQPMQERCSPGIAVSHERMSCSAWPFSSRGWMAIAEFAGMVK